MYMKKTVLSVIAVLVTMITLAGCDSNIPGSREVYYDVPEEFVGKWKDGGGRLLTSSMVQ